jgi:hypothetical protein
MFPMLSAHVKGSAERMRQREDVRQKGCCWFTGGVGCQCSSVDAAGIIPVEPVVSAEAGKYVHRTDARRENGRDCEYGVKRTTTGEVSARSGWSRLTCQRACVDSVPAPLCCETAKMERRNAIIQSGSATRRASCRP